MISSKHIDRVVAAIIGLALLLCVLGMVLAPKLASDSRGVEMEYEEKLFDTGEPLTIDIRMDDSQWQIMLDNAATEIYYACDVVINGTTFTGVGIRPKGNTSLSSIAANPNSDRYSFKLEFDQFADGQTCWGLDKLALNNSYADPTNMKEAIVYDMYRFLDADASLYNYAILSVNGEYWGVYLALEAVEDSFMLRNYGVANGELYKPDSMDFGARDEDGSFQLPDFSEIEERFRASGEMEENTVEPDPYPPVGELSPSMEALVAENETGEESASGEASGRASFEMSGFGGFGGGSGANLNYIDDDLDSYSAIWRSAKTDSTDADHRRVVTALEHISEGDDLEDYLFIDSALKYMAVHSFSVNGDSLSGTLPHNYYLYESGGRLNVIPWDYNLAFGTHGSYTASSLVNDPIDEPWGATHFFDALLENEEYLERYHAYYQKLIDEYILGGGFQTAYDRIRSQIDELVAADPNALYEYDEYDAAAQMLHDTILLRGESVRGQLDGTIPSTKDGQRAEPETLIDASNIDISAMGSFMFGGGFRRDASTEPEEDASSEASGEAAEASAEPQSSEPGTTETLDSASGEADAASGEASAEEMTESDQRQSFSDRFAASREMIEASQEMARAEQLSTVIKNAMTYGGLLLLMVIAFLLVQRYARRTYRR